MSNSKVILGILGAAAAGVVIGMLVAPEKGEDLRKNIRKTADDWIDELSNWANGNKQYADNVRGTVMTEAEHLKDEAEDSAARVKESIARRRSN